MKRGITILRSDRVTEVGRLKGPLLIAAVALFAVGCSTTPVEQPAAAPPPTQAQLVGPQGYQGATGPTGPQGPVGATGAPGYVTAGPTGIQGPQGPMGMQGPAGAPGAPGAVVVGARGATGAVGPSGMQGAYGATGARGLSMTGPTGAAGAVGPAGVQGPSGPSGVQGPNLVGPTGSTGVVGNAGGQGVSGDTGAQGYAMNGSMGATGPSGDAGTQGTKGPIGAQGQAGIVNHWTEYRQINFRKNAATIHSSGMNTISEIAAYSAKNPSLQIGIDGSMNSSSAQPIDQDLSDRRVSAVRTALIQAGVPAHKIEVGAFNDPQLPHDSSVDVLLKTASSS
jgi:OmpA family protein/collagen triple helix repeat protein